MGETKTEDIFKVCIHYELTGGLSITTFILLKLNRILEKLNISYLFFQLFSWFQVSSQLPAFQDYRVRELPRMYKVKVVFSLYNSINTTTQETDSELERHIEINIDCKTKQGLRIWTVGVLDGSSSLSSLQSQNHHAKYNIYRSKTFSREAPRSWKEQAATPSQSTRLIGARPNGF